jgi:cell division protein FtsI/penicillin-binding protein 2
VPADKPKYVYVIALEHAGEAAATAGPVARRLVLRMKELGMLEP